MFVWSFYSCLYGSHTVRWSRPGRSPGVPPLPHPPLVLLLVGLSWLGGPAQFSHCPRSQLPQNPHHFRKSRLQGQTCWVPVHRGGHGGSGEGLPQDLLVLRREAVPVQLRTWVEASGQGLVWQGAGSFFTPAAWPCLLTHRLSFVILATTY